MDQHPEVMVDLVRAGDDGPKFLRRERVDWLGRLLSAPEGTPAAQRILEQVLLLDGMVEHDGQGRQHHIDGRVAENTRLAVTTA